MDVFEKHAIKIAKKTLKMSDIGAKIMGGMSKDEAEKVLLKFYSRDYVNKLQL